MAGRHLDGQWMFQDLNRVFEENPELCELGLLLTEDPNPSDTYAPGWSPYQVSEGRNLGVPFWAAAPIYSFAFTLFRTLHSKASTCSIEEAQLLLQSTRACLLISADNYTCWNTRKILLTRDLLSIHTDLRLIDLIFSKHPKSSESWAHRRWLLQYAGHLLSPQSLESELIMCQRLAELYPKNYLAWTHRQEAARLLWRTSLSSSTSPEFYSSLAREIQRAVQWTRTHVSDHCGYHYRQVLMGQILYPCDEKADSQRFAFLKYIVALEWSHCSWLIRTFPGHEAVWMHRRFLVHFIHSALPMSPVSSEDEEKNVIAADLEAACSVLASVERWIDEEKGEDPEQGLKLPNLDTDLEFCHECRIDSGSANYEEQKQMATAHAAYVVSVLSGDICKSNIYGKQPAADSLEIAKATALKSQRNEWISELAATDTLRKSLWSSLLSSMNDQKS